MSVQHVCSAYVYSMSAQHVCTAGAVINCFGDFLVLGVGMRPRCLLGGASHEGPTRGVQQVSRLPATSVSMSMPIQ